MRKLALLTFVSLDGVMQAPGGPQEDTAGGFDLGGWTVEYFDEFLGETMGEQVGKPFAMLLGRKTYEIFAAYWPQAAKEERADIFNNAKKYVASRTLKKVEWQNSELIEGDIADAVKKLKEENGPEIQVHGSSDLIQTLIEHDLVDLLHLKIFPVTLGKGKRLFGEGAVPAGFKLLKSAASPSGVIVASYQRASEIRHGSFG